MASGGAARGACAAWDAAGVRELRAGPESVRDVALAVAVAEPRDGTHAGVVWFSK